MVLLTALWITTTSPLNTLKGRIPAWEAIEVVENPADAETPEVRNIEDEGRVVSAVEAANVKAEVDETLVTIEAVPGEAQVAQQAFARFQGVTNYQVLNTWEIGGSNPNPLDFEVTHTPLFAVVEFCEVTPPEDTVPFGVAPPPPECIEGSENNGFLVLQRDLGSLRVPPIVAFVASALLFGLGLLALHWREKDERAAKKRAAAASKAAESASPAVPETSEEPETAEEKV
jgi:DNA-binding transcriptional regulator YiaG